MIRHFDDLSQSKKNELYRIADDLNDIRMRLDGVMYSGLDTPDETIDDISNVYGHICKALDQF